MINVSNEFVEILYSLGQCDIPEKTINQARKCFLDYIGVTVAGAFVTKDKLYDYIIENQGQYQLIGLKEKVDINTSALVNSYNSHVLELDDGHRVGMMHLAAPIFSGLLPVAEKTNATIRKFLTAAVVGYEASVRVASSIQPSHKKKGFHATGTCGTIGVAMAIATLLDYSKEEMNNVLSAASTSGAGLLEVITGKSEQKPYNISNATISGINAAKFGKNFSGPKDVLCGDRGFVKNLCDEWNIDKLLTPIMDVYEIERIYMKPYAACRHCHAPIEAAIKVANLHSVDINEIEKIIVETYGLAVFGHDHKEIEGVNSAKMSIPYSVAVAMLYKQAGLDMFTEQKIGEKNIQCLANKVDVVENEELSKLVPDKRAAIIRVYLKNKDVKQLRVDYPKGEPENPIEDSELNIKVESLIKSANKNNINEIINFIKDDSNFVKEIYKITNN